MPDATKIMKPKSVDLSSALKRATEGLGAAADSVKARLHMHIEPTDDKKFIVNHDYRGGKEPTPRSERHVAANVDELVKHVKQHYSAPKPMDEPIKDSPAEESAESV
jgi:hypothetical protein